MTIRDRILELRRVPARALVPNPRNWRQHPDGQRAVLRGLLDEIGYADALLARELDGGALQLIDGHLRAETTPEASVPVLVLDVSEEEADKLLATLDPLAGMAVVDPEALGDLLEHVETGSEAVRGLLDELGKRRGPAERERADGDLPDVRIPEVYQVVVECRDEAEQRAVYERLTAEGMTCRVVVL